ncbi:hypothetical protein [Parabacteroides johnsonii]|uniref:hypothetical protein n=1 Tax=Parabacteroides johnsonii TaxID=387661 RepID=UPI003C6E7F25
MNNIFKRINFRQPKYMLPAILYIPLLGTSYFFFDLFHTEKVEVQDKTLQTTEFLNPELPDAQIKGGDGIGSKYENMAKSWGKIQDYSAVDNIERDEPDNNQEEYESQYTEEDIALLDRQEKENDLAAEAADAKRREQEALAELEKALAEARLRGTTGGHAVRNGQHRNGGSAGHDDAGQGNHRRGKPFGQSSCGDGQGKRGGEEGKDGFGLLQHTGERRSGTETHQGDHRREHQGRGRLAVCGCACWTTSKSNESVVRRGTYLYATVSGSLPDV